MRIVVLIITIGFAGCNSEVKKAPDILPSSTVWVKPFQRADTVIYVSANAEKDTIMFTAPLAQSDSTRSYEQGYSNTNYLSVGYNFTAGSYHQFAMSGDGKTRYNGDFVNIAKSSTGYESTEINFIGTLIDENIESIQKLNDTTYFFDSQKADYTGMNVERGINSFTFNTSVGVIEFVDDRNIKWVRE